MIRFKAFAIHLAISVALMSMMTGLFVWLWFPLPYFLTEGGWRGLRLIAVVSVIIGPMITLIIYNPKKSRGKLLFDLIVIALMQTISMGAGLLTISANRVVAVVYSDATLYPLGADEALQIGGKLTEIIESSETTPAYVVVDLPDNVDERQRLRRQAITTGVPLFAHDELMIPLDEDARAELDYDDIHPLEMKRVLQKGPVESYLQNPSNSHELNYFIRTSSLSGRYLTVLSRKDFKVTGWLRRVYDKKTRPKPLP